MHEDADLDQMRQSYFRISSLEGGGSYFYNRKTDAVYDVEWGAESDMVSGNLNPKFKTFYEFLEWYYNDEVIKKIQDSV